MQTADGAIPAEPSNTESRFLDSERSLAEEDQLKIKNQQILYSVTGWPIAKVLKTALCPTIRNFICG